MRLMTQCSSPTSALILLQRVTVSEVTFYRFRGARGPSVSTWWGAGTGWPHLEVFDGPVSAPDAAQRMTHLADGGPCAQRLLHRVQHVVTTLCVLPQTVQRAADLVAVPLGAQPSQPGGLLLTDQRIHAQRLVGLLLGEGEP